MRVVIAGGHGQIALLLEEQLAAAGHTPVGLIRNPDYVGDLERRGAEAVVVDLEASTPEQLASVLDGADAVVFAAGAGPGSSAERKFTVDRDGAVLLAEAAKIAGVARYVMISAIHADTFDPESTDIFQIYLRAKSEADAAVRSSGLDWTVIRPGGLINDPGTGAVRLATSTGRGSIPRADVAALVVAVLADGSTAGKQFEAISGEERIADALAAL